MRLNRLLLGAALGATGCVHTIDVFVPAPDVPAKTEVLAAVRTGEVQTYDRGAEMETNGVVRVNGRAMPTAPSDVLVVRAAAGADLGHIHVARSASSEMLTFGGILVAIAGTIASLAGAAVCNSNATSVGSDRVNDGCLALGIATTSASLGLGITMMALGIGGPLHVIEDRRPALVSIVPNGLRVVF
ncbi:MAG TPA: hypothetical protein VGH28_31745 [Polyangiaceae bacterium]|jgi:hypothetical protein